MMIEELWLRVYPFVIGAHWQLLAKTIFHFRKNTASLRFGLVLIRVEEQLNSVKMISEYL